MKKLSLACFTTVGTARPTCATFLVINPSVLHSNFAKEAGYRRERKDIDG
jgi:hypothetical protein